MKNSKLMTSPVKDEVKEDVWINSACHVCIGKCAIRVHRVDGVVVNIEGNPDCPTTHGAICSRGASGMMVLYDPNRLTVPLKRTNPEKGIGVDPKWQEISWDEALDTIADKVRQLRADDPRKMLVNGSVSNGDAAMMGRVFAETFGTPNFLSTGAGVHCGNGGHLFTHSNHGSHTRILDPNYVKYWLNFGAPSGVGAHHGVTQMSTRLAESRKKGMKHVAIEPWMGMPGLNADEWIPIRPGTDAAMGLAILNLLLNELKIYDTEYIKKYTNGPYLVGIDGHYIRDKATRKTLMWDLADGKAKTYDDPTLKDISIEGKYSVDGVAATTAFSLIKDHVKKYTPEMASKITTVPAETMRRLAKEYGAAASIGSTIVIDGKELPYRPVAVGFQKGAMGHKHSAMTGMALTLLMEVVGATAVPGSSLGITPRCLGYPGTGYPYYTVSEGVDGIMTGGGPHTTPHSPWPTRAAKKPEKPGMNDFVPTSGDSILFLWDLLEQEKYKLPYKIEFLLNTTGNLIMNLVDPATVEKAFKEIKFNVSFNLYLDESTDLADIVLPDTCYLERLSMPEVSNSPVDHWVYQIRQPVVEPGFQRRPAHQVMLDVAERAGMLGEMYRTMNKSYGIREPYALDPAKKYTWEEIVDRKMKSTFGPEHGLDWFKENGFITWPKKVEEVYYRAFVKGRVPIYFENFLTVGEQMEQIKKEHGIPGFDTSDFQAMPDWKPCASYEEKRPDFDLFGIYYRIPTHTFGSTYNNPWLDEVSRMETHVYNIALNTETAKKRGIKEGDWLTFESAGTGYKAEGRAVLMETIHPEVIAYCGGGGHWSKHSPIASQRDNGICPTWLIPFSWDYIDPVTFQLDLCVKVKVTKKV